MTIQLFRHHVYPESIQNVTNVLQSGWTGLGPVTEQFEQEISKYLDAPYTIALNSGTGALLIAIACLGAPKGSSIITTPLTFISTNHCILHMGYRPIFADIEPETGNIDPESIERLLHLHTIKAIMVVHYGGMPVNMDAIYEISNRYQIPVIEDAAHAFGAEYQGAKIGSKHSSLCCFSLHSVKPLAIGDGGLLTTNDPIIDKFARQLRWCGIDKSTSNRTDQAGYRWDYNVTMAGFKSHMNDIQAAIGLGQLKHYEEDRKYRQILVDKYRELLNNVSGIELLKTFPDRVSANHLFVVKVPTHKKSNIMDFLYNRNIQIGCHYRLSTDYEMYKKSETDSECKNAREFFERCISLPLHIDLTTEDITYIVDCIKEGIKEEENKC